MKKKIDIDFFEKGNSKICVSVMGKTSEEVISNLSAVLELPIDIIEWRADFFDDLYTLEENHKILSEIASRTDKSIIFTIRTIDEGGNVLIETQKYKEILLDVVEDCNVDIVDVQYMMGSAITEEIVEKAHKNNTLIIGSYHDFAKTPDDKFIYDTLKGMYHAEMDISKMALMPNEKMDVLRVLEQTQAINDDISDIKTVTMTMGELGTISRIIGGQFGSVMTFGAAAEVSAPGQINASKLKNLMEELNF